MGTKKNDADPLRLLTLFESGVLTVRLNDHPLLKVDAESKEVGLDVAGVKESGIKLSKITEVESGGKKGVRGMLSGAGSAAKGLSEMGWNVTLWDNRSEVITMGKGVSGLTGHMRVNPLKVHKLLDML